MALNKKVKTFLIGTSEGLKKEFSRKPGQENKTIPDDSKGYLLYVAELCSGILTLDGLFRMGYAVKRGIKDRTLFQPDYSNCFDVPGIVGYIREKQ